MKTPLAILLMCLCTSFGAIADSGDDNTNTLKPTQNEPKSLCTEIKKSMISIGKGFQELDKSYFHDQHFKQNSDLRKTGIYLFRNDRWIEEKRSKQKKA